MVSPRRGRSSSPTPPFALCGKSTDSLCGTSTEAGSPPDLPSRGGNPPATNHHREVGYGRILAEPPAPGPCGPGFASIRGGYRFTTNSLPSRPRLLGVRLPYRGCRPLPNVPPVRCKYRGSPRRESPPPVPPEPCRPHPLRPRPPRAAGRFFAGAWRIFAPNAALSIGARRYGDLPCKRSTVPS
jgi:hypothetical protein